MSGTIEARRRFRFVSGFLVHQQGLLHKDGALKGLNSRNDDVFVPGAWVHFRMIFVSGRIQCSKCQRKHRSSGLSGSSSRSNSEIVLMISI